MDKYYGLYRGICTRNRDPEGRFRIKVRVPAVSGKEETGWVLPCLPPGWKSHRLLDEHDSETDERGLDKLDIKYDDSSDAGEHGGHETGDGSHSHEHRLLQQVPSVDEQVWIMYEQGDLSHPVWMGVW